MVTPVHKTAVKITWSKTQAGTKGKHQTWPVHIYTEHWESQTSGRMSSQKNKSTAHVGTNASWCINSSYFSPEIRIYKNQWKLEMGHNLETLSDCRQHTCGLYDIKPLGFRNSAWIVPGAALFSKHKTVKIRDLNTLSAFLNQNAGLFPGKSFPQIPKASNNPSTFLSQLMDTDSEEFEWKS